MRAKSSKEEVKDQIKNRSLSPKIYKWQINIILNFIHFVKFDFHFFARLERKVAICSHMWYNKVTFTPSPISDKRKGTGRANQFPGGARPNVLGRL